MRKKRFSLLSLLLAALAAILLTLAVTAASAVLLLGRTGLGVAEAMLLIHTRFVGEADLPKAADAAMDTLVTSLGDRWSYYVDAEGYQHVLESQNNAYVGIGVTVDYRGDEGVYVVSVEESSPAWRGGVTAGDTILAVDGVALTGEERTRVVALVRGKRGTEVVLTLRGEEGETRTLSVTRDSIRQRPVSYELLADQTGLVTIKNFNRRCAEEGIAAVDELLSQGAKRLVFDVRNNGGGYLDELTALLDRLLPEGVIFRSGDKKGDTGSVSSDENCVDVPMAVLVNGGTYSAAELFAAQLREMGRAVVVGTKTSGKGFSQQTLPLVSGGALNLSTATYFTGGGVSLIGTGVTLDRETALTDGESALLSGGELPPEQDPQYQAARAQLE